jgi:hypothetical protein
MNRKQRIANTSTHARLMMFLFTWRALGREERRVLRQTVYPSVYPPKAK